MFGCRRLKGSRGVHYILTFRENSLYHTAPVQGTTQYPTRYKQGCKEDPSLLNTFREDALGLVPSVWRMDQGRVHILNSTGGWIREGSIYFKYDTIGGNTPLMGNTLRHPSQLSL
jgi:hypothetical protein